MTDHILHCNSYLVQVKCQSKNFCWVFPDHDYCMITAVQAGQPRAFYNYKFERILVQCSFFFVISDVEIGPNPSNGRKMR